jgi:hypothetical protein
MAYLIPKCTSFCRYFCPPLLRRSQQADHLLKPPPPSPPHLPQSPLAFFSPASVWAGWPCHRSGDIFTHPTGQGIFLHMPQVRGHFYTSHRSGDIFTHATGQGTFLPMPGPGNIFTHWRLVISLSENIATHSCPFTKSIFCLHPAKTAEA